LFTFFHPSLHETSAWINSPWVGTWLVSDAPTLNRKYHYLRWGPGQNMSDPSCTIEHLVCQQPTEGNRLPAVRWVDRSCSPTVYRQLTHVLALQYLVNAWQSPIQSQMGQMNFTVQSQFFIYFSPGPSFGPSRQWGRVGHLVPLFGLRGATPGLRQLQ
jgi:hypothetical protein